MEMMTSSWTDDRMDDLKHQVDELGRRIDQGFAMQRQEMNAGFDRMESQVEARFEKVDERFAEVEVRFDKVDQRFEKVDERFDKVEDRFEKVDERFEKVEDRFERVDDRFGKVDDRFETVDQRFHRTQEMIIGLHATMTRVSLTLAFAAIGLVATQTGLILTQL
jgi:uncharacterized protein (DUF3084 family)